MVDNETPVISSMLMDRSEPLGNSAGSDGRRRLHTKIANTSAEPIPVSLYPGLGNLLSFVGLTSPGTLQTPVSSLVPALTTRTLFQAYVICRMPALFEIKIDGSTIGSGRTGASQMNARYSWLPPYSVLAGSTITVEFTALIGTPISAFEVYLQAADIA